VRIIHLRRASDYISSQTDGHTAGAVGPERYDEELQMSTISTAAAAPRGIARQSWGGRLVATLERWLIAYMTWRLEQAAIAQLSAMSDRQLKDIGLTRSEIPNAVSEPSTRLQRRS
jgi:uncharacterized protein YjiS (DUF1127 family)